MEEILSLLGSVTSTIDVPFSSFCPVMGERRQRIAGHRLVPSAWWPTKMTQPLFEYR